MVKNYQLSIIDPKNLSQKTIATITHGVYLNAYKYAPVSYENLRTAKQVLENPERIFTGIRRFNEGGWCFTGRPREWHVKENVTAAFPDNLVFAVYLNPALCVYEWRAEAAAENDPYSPIDWEDRYNALIWKRIS